MAAADDLMMSHPLLFLASWFICKIAQINRWPRLTLGQSGHQGQTVISLVSGF